MKRFRSGALLEVFEELDSTSLEARRRSIAPTLRPTWILALRQTAGYGRRGSPWQQTEGDLAATFMMPAPFAPEILPELSFVAAIAVADALGAFIDGGRIRCKWPNDMLIDGAKIGGLILELLEAHPQRVVAIGVGVNIVSRPENVAYRTARLMDFAPAPDPRVLCEVIDDRLVTAMNLWRDGGFAPVREAWLAVAAGLDEQISVRLPGETIEGIFRGIDAAGALILETPDGGRRRLAAGEVTLRYSAL